MSIARRLRARAGLPNFSVGASPPSVSGSSTSSSISSGPATASAVGGSGTFTYAWARVGGPTSISAVNAGNATTTFAGSGLSIGTTSATFACTVTDTVTSQILVTNIVTVSLTRTSPPLSVSVSSPNGVGNSSSTITVTSTCSASVSGGSGSYSYTWPDIAGFSKSPSGSVCYYSCSLAPGEHRFGSGTLYVYDGISTEPCGFNVICDNFGSPPPAFSVAVTDGSVSGSSTDGTGQVETGSTTAVPTGAVGGVTYSWSRTSGEGFVVSGSLATTTFGYNASSNGTRYGTFRVTATDSLGRSDYEDVSASFYAFFPPPI